MNKDLAVYKSLLATLFKNSFRFEKIKRKDGHRDNRAAAKVGMVVGAIVFGLYAAMMAVMITSAAIPMGLQEEILYTLLAMAQLIVLFFGAVAVMGYLYFSNDNNLLASLPIKPTIVFSAKFTMAYLSELVFSVAISIPMLTAYGITCLAMGVGLGWHFFVLMPIAVLVLPIIPLFLITLISMPLMYIVSFFRRRSVGNSIVLGILYLGAMALYFSFVFGMQSLTVYTDDTAAISQTGINLFRGVRNATIYHYNLVKALSNQNALLNFFIYLVGNIALLAIVVTLSSFFYRKAIAVIIEGTAGKSKSQKKTEKAATAEKASVYRSFFFKEVRTLVNTPVLLVSTFMSLLLPPLLMVFLSFTMTPSIGGADGGMDARMFMTGYATFISFMMISSTNMVATIGISREGKHLYILKTLPISVKMIIKCKLMFAGILTLTSTVIMGVTYPLVLGITNPLAIIMFPLVVFTGAFGVNAIALYSDLKKPNLNWSNVSELTKNNKNTLKFMLPVLLVGFAYLIVGMLLAFQDMISGTLEYLLFFVLAAVPAAIMLAISLSKLFKNPEELFARIGN